MVDLKASYRPTISFRPIQPGDRELLEKIHADLFPVRYEAEFFQNVVSGCDIVSWGAVDSGRADGECGELIGFVTARIVPARESEIGDMLKNDFRRSDPMLVYILTLGVVESYRNLGIAASLIGEVIKYGSNFPTCQAVYLHVISYNNAAIHLYNKMSFKCVRKLHDFYLIDGKHYDSYLFVYFINGGQSPCSLLELVRVAVAYLRSGLRSLTKGLWNSRDRKGSPKRTKCKETGCLLSKSQSKRILSADGSVNYEFV